MYPINVKCIRDNSKFNLIEGQVYLGIVKHGSTNNIVIEIHLPHEPRLVFCSPEGFKEYFELTV